MKKYYLNKVVQANGDHEVHSENCQYLPSPQNQIFLGLFYSCETAVTEAKRRYPSAKINGCYYCSPKCHTR
ncbi:hypothetical protein [Chryseobacterium sp. CT-SW4]|uniref:hypothetical protein n=1 Tax=Chryseobacterium sp. SW-1 TaxID=3157343 RepID=UPI003B018C77